MRHKLLAIISTITTLVCFALITSTGVSAQTSTPKLVIDRPGGLDLKPIEVPLFLSIDQVRNFSPLSFISLGITLIFIAITMMWTVIIFRAAVTYIRSEGDEDKMATSRKKITNVFASIAVLFVSVVIIGVVANIIGVGNFWEWPKSFSFCNSDFSRDPDAYYFQYFLRRSSEGATTEQIDQECFGG